MPGHRADHRRAQRHRDLNGHRLDGVGESNGGILNSDGHDNVVIRGGGGGSIAQFGRGIEMGNTVDSRIRGVRFKRTDNQLSSIGILLYSSTGVVVKNNEITDTNEATAIGMLLQGTTKTEVTGNGVSAMSGEDSVGIQVSLLGQDNVIDDNVVRAIRGRGVLVFASVGTRLTRNRVVRGKDRGIEIGDDSDDTLVKRNTLIRNEDGILVLSSTTTNDTRIIKNTARRSEEDGIEVDLSDAAIGRNLVLDNADWGIEADSGVSDLGGNRAAGNGEAAQCLNVACSPP